MKRISYAKLSKGSRVQLMSTDNCELGSVLMNIVCGGYRVNGVFWNKVSNVRGDPINADGLQDIILFRYRGRLSNVFFWMINVAGSWGEIMLMSPIH